MNPWKTIKQVWRWLRGEPTPPAARKMPPDLNWEAERMVRQFQRDRLADNWRPIHQSLFHKDALRYVRAVRRFYARRPRPWRSPANIVRGGR